MHTYKNEKEDAIEAEFIKWKIAKIAKTWKGGKAKRESDKEKNLERGTCSIAGLSLLKKCRTVLWKKLGAYPLKN